MDERVREAVKDINARRNPAPSAGLKLWTTDDALSIMAQAIMQLDLAVQRLDTTQTNHLVSHIALEQASGERAASPASSPTMASPTTDNRSDAPDGPTPAQTSLLSRVLGVMTEAELTHAEQCSECRGLLEFSLPQFRMHVPAAAGTTSTYQSPASSSSAGGSAPAQSPSSESIELKRPTLVLKDENAGTAPAGIDSFDFNPPHSPAGGQG